MADGSSPLAADVSCAAEAGAIVFALAGRRYAIGLEVVEGIVPPPPLSRVPYAAPGLLGAGNLAGQVVPIVDLAALLPGPAVRRRYNGGGEVLRVRAAGGRVGLWVDRTERLVAAGTAIGDAADLIDPEPLVGAGMAAPDIGVDMRNPLGEVGELVQPRGARDHESYFLMEAAGEQILLPYEAVLEFVPPPSFAPVPGTPAGFLGVGILRGDAVPMLSLAVLLGLPSGEPPTVFVVVLLPSGHRVLLGCRSVIGSRDGEEGRHFDPRGALPRALRRIVTSFPKAETQEAAAERGTATFLSFIVDRQRYALPVEAVERVVPPQRPIALPRLANAASAIAAAIELRGQIVPVARLGSAAAGPPSVYVILRGKAGLIALGAERAERLVALRPEQIAPPPNGDALIDGVAIPGDGGDVLRILAPGRIGSAA
ncbi:MAG TPA: chemotaxis protein CheW [Stellaceae bacterium]|jgi:chemotaxis signal transduction protein